MIENAEQISEKIVTNIIPLEAEKKPMSRLTPESPWESLNPDQYILFQTAMAQYGIIISDDDTFLIESNPHSIKRNEKSIVKVGEHGMYEMCVFNGTTIRRRT